MLWYLWGDVEGSDGMNRVAWEHRGRRYVSGMMVDDA